MSHIRKISRIEARLLVDAAQDGELTPTNEQLAARFDAVLVGSTDLDLFYHVNRASSEDLPGELVSETFDYLPAAIKGRVLESTYESDEIDADGNEATVTRSVKVDDLPPGAKTTATNLPPHRFAGE